MKKFLCLNKKAGLFILIILMTLVTLVGCSGNQALANGDFEQGSGTKITQWSQRNYQKDVGDTACTTISLVADGYSGQAVKIASNSANDARIYQKLAVKKNSTYKVTAMVKIEGTLVGGNGFNISAIETFGHSEALYTTDGKWQQQTAYFTTGAKQTSLELSFGLGGYSNESAGIVYIDDVQIEKVSKVPGGVEPFSVESYQTQKKEAGSDTPWYFQALFIVLVVGLVMYVMATIMRHDDEKVALGKSLSEPRARLDKKDYIVLAVLTLVCACTSFYKLGNAEGVSSHWKPVASGEYVIVEFPEETKISRVTLNPNVPNTSNAAYEVAYENASGEYQEAFSFDRDDIAFFEWHLKNVTFTTKRVRVTVKVRGLGLNEMAFWEKDAEGNYTLVPVTVVETYSTDETNPHTPDKLFDEQDLAQAYRTFENGTYFDEIYFPRTAYEHMNGLPIYEVTHPPLGKTIISIGISLFGMNPFGWRFMGTLLGVCLVPIMYLLAFKLFKKRGYAFIAAFLLMTDFMRTTQTRLATIDTYSVFFILLMYYFMYDYFSQRSYDRPFWKGMVSLGLSGLCFGLGAAAKWTSIYAGVGLAVLFFMAKIAESMDVSSGRYKIPAGKKSWFVGNFIPTCLMCVVFFVIIPLTIYVLSYIPYMASNPDKSLIEIVLDNQEYMYNYHANLNATHSYQSSWYSWIIDGRPIYYYSSASAGLPAGIRASVVSMGNPAIWWTGLACIIPALYFAWKRKEKMMLVVFLGYACQLFPWILVTRCTFIYHYFTAVPFLILMIVYVIKCLYEDKVINRWVIGGYLLLVLVLYVLFYPVMVGIPVKEAYIDGLRWFSTWSF
ncbi:MAG: glycosyltransferase family 39 protein [Clostridia bacterium]|nr:glycosyltransferase family 39 protein [Clostridia bacterium]